MSNSSTSPTPPISSSASASAGLSFSDPATLGSLGTRLALGVSAAFIIILYGFIPHTEGYAGQIFSVFHRIYVDWHEEEWAHGALVPFAAAFMIYWRWDKIGKVPIQPSNTGTALLLITLVVFWFGLKAGHHYIGNISCWLMIGALVITFFGWRFFFAVFWVWLFLLMAFPFLVLEQTLGFPLRMLMSYLTSEFLNIIGIPNLLSGSAIVSAPNLEANQPQGALFALEVDNPCSGINSLFALSMITYVYAFTMMKRQWQFLTILAAAPLLAILGNFLRMLMLVFGTLWFGTDIAIGSHEDPSAYHMIAGFVVFLGAFGGMLLLGEFLPRIEKRWMPTHDDTSGESTEPTKEKAKRA